MGAFALAACPPPELHTAAASHSLLVTSSEGLTPASQGALVTLAHPPVLWAVWSLTACLPG